MTDEKDFPESLPPVVPPTPVKTVAKGGRGRPYPGSSFWLSLGATRGRTSPGALPRFRLARLFASHLARRLVVAETEPARTIGVIEAGVSAFAAAASPRTSVLI